MRTQFHVFVGLAILAAVSIGAPDLALARGCGGGSNQQNANPQGGGDGGHHGRRNRGRGKGDHNGPRGGPRSGPRGHHNGPHGPHLRRPPGHRGHGGPNVDVTVGGYGYPGGRVGPPTPACYELARLRSELTSLWNLRQQVNSGKRIVAEDEGGNARIMSPRAYSRQAQNQALDSGGGVGESAYDLAAQQRQMAEVRERGLAMVDYRISNTQDQIGQLQYECPE